MRGFRGTVQGGVSQASARRAGRAEAIGHSETTENFV